MSTRAKRHNGEGSWGKKTVKGNTYKYFKKTYPDYGEKTFYGKTEGAVRKKIKEFEVNLEEEIEKKKLTGISTKEDVTFNDYIIYWLENVKKNELTPRGYDSYESAINSRITNLKEFDLGSKQLNQLNYNNEGFHIMKDYVNALIKHGYARKTIDEICGIIKQCCEYASHPNRQDLKYNYMKDVTMPTEDNVKTKKREIKFMSKEEMDLLYETSKLTNTKGDSVGGKIGELKYGNNGKAIVIIMYTGMRIGELSNLKWKDVDFKHEIIHIHTSLSYVKNRSKEKNSENKYVFIEKSTKTENGDRFVGISERCKEALEYFLQFKTSEEGYVCINRYGNHVTKNTIRKTLIRMTQRAGLAQYTPHELRHSFGSVLLEESDNTDVTIAAISKMLGHSDITITYNIYIHILKKRIAKTIKIFDNKKEIDLENNLIKNNETK